MTKYFVVSEAELKELAEAADEASDSYYGVNRINKAKAACRMREVPEWATHFVDGEPGTEDLSGWEEIKR